MNTRTLVASRRPPGWTALIESGSRSYLRRMRRTSTEEFLDALADVIADRVAAKVVEAAKASPTPEKVPAWLDGPKLPRRRQRPPIEGEWTPEKALRSAGLVTFGDPGYKESLDKYLEWNRRHEAELQTRAQMRKAVRLLEKLLQPAAPQRVP